MKKTCRIVMLALLVTTVFACKKDKGDTDNNNPTNSIISSWELAEAGSSWVPNQTYEPGNGNVLEVYGDTYVMYKNGAVVEQGNYTTTPDGNVEANVMLVGLKDKYKTRIDFTNITPSRLMLNTWFYVEDNKLYLISGNYALDSGSRKVYRRRSHRIDED